MTYIILMVICFALLMLVRIPIPFALIVSTMVYFLGVDLPLDIVMLIFSIDSFEIMDAANKQHPTGGVARPVIRLILINTPA